MVADIVEMPAVPDDSFELVLAMGDPLSICSDPVRAVREMRRITTPGGIIIATVDNKLAALDHFVERGNLDELEEFIHSSRTRWLTADQREQFELKTFTPASLRKLFEGAGFEVMQIAGKTIIPVRQNKILFTKPEAMERLLRLEQDLSKDPASAARAGHLQVVARRGCKGTRPCALAMSTMRVAWEGQGCGFKSRHPDLTGRNFGLARFSSSSVCPTIACFIPCGSTSIQEINGKPELMATSGGI